MENKVNTSNFLKQTEGLTERILESQQNFLNKYPMYRAKNTIAKTLTLLLCAIFLISCEADDAQQKKTESTVLTEDKIMSENLIGKYESVYGSQNPGSITIYEGVVSVYTIKYSGTFKIDFSTPYFNPDCFIKINLANGEMLHLSLFRSINRIHLTKVYKDGSEEELGSFEKPKEETTPAQDQPQTNLN